MPLARHRQPMCWGAGSHEQPEALPQKKVIAVVDDEPDILELIGLHLTRAGFTVKSFAAARPLLQYLEKQLPDLLVLDLMLPDGDGLEICKSLKREAAHQRPAHPDPDRQGRKAGHRSRAGVRCRRLPGQALLARGAGGPGQGHPAPEFRARPPDDGDLIRVGEMLAIDQGRHRRWSTASPSTLTSTEFSILLILSRNPGWVFTREKILDALWGDEKAVIDRTIDVHIKHLREKLGPAGALIKNIRGVGYKIEP